MLKKVKSKGFTIIELLIVIVVIGILATLVLNTIGSARTRSEAAAISNQLNAFKSGFIGVATSEGRDTWWTENTLEACDNHSLSANPYINQVALNCPGFNDFIQNPVIEYQGTNLAFRYDNEGDGPVDIRTCGTVSLGTNFFSSANVLPDDILDELDNIYDDGDGRTCGVLRWSASNAVFYRFGTQNNVQ